MEQQHLGRKKAYVTLISVIILGAIALLVLTTSIAIDTESIFATDILEQSKQAKALADTCAEYTINQLKLSNTYAGNTTLSIGSLSCSMSAISGTGNTNRSFTTSSTFGDVTRKTSITITTINPTTVIGSWQEIP